MACGGPHPACVCARRIAVNLHQGTVGMPRAASRRVDDGLPWSGTSPWQAKADICQVVPSCKLRSMQALTDFGRMRALTREPGKPKEWRRPPCRRRSNVEHDASSLGRCRHGGGSAQDMVPFDSFCRICEPQIADRHPGKNRGPRIACSKAWKSFTIAGRHDNPVKRSRIFQSILAFL